MKVLTQIARILTGLVFVLSGFVKGVDPMGTAFKLSDYFTAFNAGFMHDLALPLAIFLCLVEFITGIMLLTGSLVKPASWMAAIFMAFFTPLTLVLAVFNPVSDCGCFGDAIHLTNWETFFKNIVITLIVVFVFIRRNDLTGVLSVRTGLNTSLVMMFLFLLFMRYNLSYLPVIDFRPYMTGTDIPEAMSFPPGAAPDQYDIRFIYEKDGVQKEFSLDNYPADDTTWKFVDQKSVLVSKGYEPPVHGFLLVDGQGTDMTDHILSDQRYVMLMIARRLEEADRKGLRKGFDLGIFMQNEGYDFYIVTATPHEEAQKIVTGFNALFADETTLKTVVRSNPGFVLLQNGTVIGKWSYHGLPDNEAFSGDLNSMALKEQTRKHNRLVIFCTILAVSLCVSLTMPHRFTVKYPEANETS
jgi:uncharacterized membrane protein YphA (DoxX/SURF4 family)